MNWKNVQKETNQGMCLVLSYLVAPVNLIKLKFQKDPKVRDKV